MKIDKTTAKRLYPESPDWFKSLLENAFGIDKLKSFNYENINSFEDACKVLGINGKDVFHENDRPDEVAYKKLKTIVRAINMDEDFETWEPDWNNNSQQKWWPWFNLSSGFSFSGSYYYCDGTIASVGSRLCFRNKERSNYTAKKFIDLYEQLLTIKN